jgi:flagellar biosynthesis anti-sigma factor FlgM
MKVDNSGRGPNLPLDRADETARTSGAGVPKAPQSQPSTVEDRLTLSPDAQAAQAAAALPEVEPAVRQELVDRMRQLLDKGELGQDADRLADAILNRWLGPE